MSFEHLPVSMREVSAPSVLTPEPVISFAERWAAWQARGAAHDRAVRRKMSIAAPALSAAAAVL